MRFSWLAKLQIETQLGNDLSWCLLVDGCFEPNEVFWLSSVLTSGMTFIDIGANEGLFSLLAGRCVAPGGRVVAVEPSSREVQRLIRNLQLNPGLPVTVRQVALGSHEGEAILKVADESHSGHNTLGEFPYAGVSCVRTERIPLMTLDSLIAREQLDRVDVLKVDVEGGELGVLRGGRKTLEQFRPKILFELHEPALRAQGASPAEVLGLLKKLGYEVRCLDPQTGRFVEQTSPDHISDNMVAVPKEHR
jgi:FkbM family methyltransferase